MQSMANILTTALKGKCQEMPGKINRISLFVFEHLLPLFSENGLFGLLLSEYFQYCVNEKVS